MGRFLLRIHARALTIDTDANASIVHQLSLGWCGPVNLLGVIEDMGGAWRSPAGRRSAMALTMTQAQPTAASWNSFARQRSHWQLRSGLVCATSNDRLIMDGANRQRHDLQRIRKRCRAARPLAD
jgi:hypothetical protein